MKRDSVTRVLPLDFFFLHESNSSGPIIQTLKCFCIFVEIFTCANRSFGLCSVIDIAESTMLYLNFQFSNLKRQFYEIFNTFLWFCCFLSPPLKIIILLSFTSSNILQFTTLYYVNLCKYTRYSYKENVAFGLRKPFDICISCKKLYKLH